MRNVEILVKLLLDRTVDDDEQVLDCVLRLIEKLAFHE